MESIKEVLTSKKVKRVQSGQKKFLNENKEEKAICISKKHSS